MICERQERHVTCHVMDVDVAKGSRGATKGAPRRRMEHMIATVSHGEQALATAGR